MWSHSWWKYANSDIKYSTSCTFSMSLTFTRTIFVFKYSCRIFFSNTIFRRHIKAQGVWTRKVYVTQLPTDAIVVPVGKSISVITEPRQTNSFTISICRQRILDFGVIHHQARISRIAFDITQISSNISLGKVNVNNVVSILKQLEISTYLPISEMSKIT